MPKILLDTHVLLWWTENPKLLSKQALETIKDIDNQIFVSHVTAWEFHIKQTLGKLSLPASYEDMMLRAGFSQLPITLSHINMLKSLPLIHNDPFDRLLIGQALVENLTIITRDVDMMKYHVSILKT